MTSSYTPPGSTVEVIIKKDAVPARPPVLPLCLVGPAVVIAPRTMLGTYAPGTSSSVTLPGAASGDISGVEVFLRATANGRSIGLFPVPETGASPGYDLVGTAVLLDPGLTLAYSVLSVGNNSPDTITPAVFSGVPSGITFTDTKVDFLSRGWQPGDVLDIVVSAPSNLAGTYRSYSYVASGSAVSAFKVQKIADPEVGTPDLVDSFSVTAAGGTAFNGGASISSHAPYTLGVGALTSAATTATAVVPTGHGIQVGDKIIVAGAAQSPYNGTYAVATSAATTITYTFAGSGTSPATGTITITPSTRGSTIFVSTVDVGVASTPFTGSAPNYPFSTTTLPGSASAPVTVGPFVPSDWDALFTNGVAVGDYLRVSGDSTADANADYLITAVDTVLKKLTLARSASETAVTAPVTTGGGAITLLRVLKGSLDAPGAAGDYVTYPVGSVTNEYNILSATPKQIAVATVLAGLGTGAPTTLTQRRGFLFTAASASYDAIRRISSGYTADVLVSYNYKNRALALDGLTEITNGEDVETLLGYVTPSNPLAFAANIAVQAGATAANTSFFVLALAEDTLDAFTDAMTILERNEVYRIVPLSKSEAVQSAYKAHVDALCLPDAKLERRLFISTDILGVEVVVASQSGVISGGNTITAVAANWADVSPGDVVKILDVNGNVTEEHRVASVNSGAHYATILGTFTATSTQTFRVDTYPPTRGDQAEHWKLEAEAYGDPNVTIVRPGAFSFTYTDKTGTTPTDKTVTVDGFYGAVAYAAFRGTRPVHTPGTGWSISGIRRVIGASEYFTPDEMNTIAEGGATILVQNTKNGLPSSRDSRTSDNTSLISVTECIQENIHYCSKTIRLALKGLTGKYLITPQYLSMLQGVATSVQRALVDSGNLLDDSSILSIQQDTEQPDRTFMDVDWLMPVPGNKIRVRAFISI